MAESHFFMGRDDSADFVSFLIERFSAEFVPERSPDPPPFPRYRALAEVQGRIDEDVRRSRSSRFAVLSPKWERLPLVFNEVHANDGQHFFSLSQRYGGPAFDFILSRSWADADRRWIVAGSFGDYPYYIEDQEFLTDHSLYRTFQRPDTMAEAHKEVRTYLRRNGCRSVCREDGHSGPWIMRAALRDYEAGMWLRGGDWHFDPKGGGLSRQL
ncbi:hypothetical protein NA78x_000410 [Anatilimnocola sp. NA78]|uniref:hypothetical protein n=1 Tax=Anatilimnocola sp. NA78 TaxID=3415683 RepID=UPI003CE4DA97